MTSRLEFQFVSTNSFCLHVAQSPGDHGRLVILLHGFPEFWYGWRHQIPALAEAGFRVWAPDQRGYNLSDKPADVASYALDELANDVIGLIDAAGESRASVVGHDWGAAVAWWVALRHPERIERLVILNVPHPAVMQRHLRRSFAQLRRSWYIFFFQMPWVPEASCRWGHWWSVVRAMQASSRRGTLTAEDVEHYRTAWSQPQAFRSMIHWYRAVLRNPPKMPRDIRIHVPTLIIWGARDKFLDRAMTGPSLELCDDGRLVVLEEATHWIQHKESGVSQRPHPRSPRELMLDRFRRQIYPEGEIRP